MKPVVHLHACLPALKWNIAPASLRDVGLDYTLTMLPMVLPSFVLKGSLEELGRYC
jgi:hypothetical protein